MKKSSRAPRPKGVSKPEHKLAQRLAAFDEDTKRSMDSFHNGHMVQRDDDKLKFLHRPGTLRRR